MVNIRHALQKVKDDPGQAAVTNGLSVGWVVGVSQGRLACDGVRAAGSLGGCYLGRGNGGPALGRAHST